MPSDARLMHAMQAFAALFTQYRSAVAATLEDVRGKLTSHSTDATGRTAQLATELGAFATGRIDATRLSALLGEQDQLAPMAVERLERAASTLRDIAERGDELMHVQLMAGSDLTSAVGERLAEIGRAFGAARVAASQYASPPTAQEESILAGLPFGDWTAAERRLAPALVVSLDGADLHPAGLAAFLDGAVKIVLIVEGEAPPASLVRLITPGVFVAQSADPSICSRIAQWPGTAIAAIVPASCAQFVHDPSAGPELWHRVQVQPLPPPPAARIGGQTVAQQVEEVRHLEALAHQPVAAGVTAGAGEPAVNPVDRVAAWLLRQANFTEQAGGN